jgi:hypothetical protein
MIGMEVYTRYEVKAGGSVVLRAAANVNTNRVLLAIPFPDEVVEARDVELKVTAPGGIAVAPQDIVYDRTGIYCTVPTDRGEPLTAEFGYTAFGRERFGLRPSIIP